MALFLMMPILVNKNLGVKGPVEIEAYARKQMIEEASELDAFDNVTEEEVLSLWRSFKSSGLTGYEAWHAIVTGIALDMAFARSRNLKQVEQ